MGSNLRPYSFEYETGKRRTYRSSNPIVRERDRNTARANPLYPGSKPVEHHAYQHDSQWEWCVVCCCEKGNWVHEEHQLVIV